MNRVCVICGKPIVSKRYNTKTCSPTCSEELHQRTSRAYARALYKKKHAEKVKEREQQALIGTCIMCGKKFTRNFKGERFCSDECRFDSPLYKLLLYKEKECGL